RLDHEPIRLIRTYALLEGGIGLYNLALPILIRAADPVFGTLYASAYNSFFVLALARLVIVFLLLIVPATLMGATLPILIRFYVDHIAAVGAEAGRVYTANTWGAALGTAAGGFILIPRFGVLAALFFAVAVNLLVAITAFVLSQREDTDSVVQAEDGASAGPRLILFAMLASGFAALMNEVAWTRVLGLVVGPTTYAFTLMLVSMITGLGLGAAIGAYWTRRRTTSLATFAWIEIGVAATTLALIPAFGRLPVWIGRLVTRYVDSFASIQLAEFFIFFGLMLAPTTLLGMTFPVASRLYARSNSLLGTEVSAVYAFNTVGGILGSLVAGFFLIPAIGSQSTLATASLISVLTAVALWRGLLPAVAFLAVFAGAILMPRWDPELMSSGAYKYAPYYAANLDLESVLKSGDLLYFKEGATTTVSAKKARGSVMLAIDGKVDATDSGDMTTQKMLGHLPLLLSKDAKNVAVIGLGSGVTAGAALKHPIESIDIIEISPEVVAASQFFNHVNHGALQDPRTRLIVGDGRNHLRYIDRRYDVIISEPSNPWMSGMASLFSQEFFTEALRKLSPSGIHCQWLHSYNMATEDLRTIIASFRSVFPHAQLWALNENDFLLLGSPSRIEVNEATFTRNFDRVAEDLKTVQIYDTFSVLSLYLLEDQDLDTFAQSAALNTDDHPLLEFRAPQFIYANTTVENLAALTGIKRQAPRPSAVEKSIATATAENHRNKGQMYAAAESFKQAVAEFQAALSANTNDEISWRGLVENARNDVDLKQVETFFENTLKTHPLPIVPLAASDFYLRVLNHDKAIAMLQ
ncbi:MAG: fused MFS/spermidine synthase, partial [Acidobacteria bacterium]|nr:fused MFS/spermidine synthase [Acidobacteriota bacterium]